MDIKTAGDNRINSIRNKILRLCLVLVIGAIVLTAVMGCVLLWMQRNMNSASDKNQNTVVREKSRESMLLSAKLDLIDTILLSTLATDHELFIKKHDFELLSKEVQNIIEHPENYGECEVDPPSLKNAGEFSLQVLYADSAAENDEEVNRLIRKLANLAPMMEEIISGTDGMTKDVYIAMPNGTCLVMDDLSEIKFDDNENLIKYDPRTRPWYMAAEQSGEFAFTLAVPSYFLGIPELEYSVPIYVDGQLAAVLQGSTEIRRIQEMLETVFSGETGFTILVSEEGRLVFSPNKTGDLAMGGVVDNRGIYSGDISGFIDDIDNEELKNFIKAALKEDFGFGEVTVDGVEYYAAYSAMDSINWTQMTFISVSEMDRPTDNLLAAMDEANRETRAEFGDEFRKIILISLIVIILLIVVTVIASVTLSGKLSGPISLMTGRVRDMTGEEFKFNMEDAYRTGDEIEVLAGTFENLSDKMKDHIEKILAFTAEKERMGAELDVAARIQKNMLPVDFPLFPDNTQFSLYASMTPAKEVGGDFYDAFLMDDDHLCMVMGDVSGKGIPAALFMVISKTLIKNRAQMGGKPSEILRDVNNGLCEGNKEMMFVTVWLGILTLSTGEVIEANAGHECPAIRKNGEDFTLIDKEHGIVLGIIPGSKYEDDTFMLGAGDSLFVHTDGVSDAFNEKDERLGIEGMMDILNAHKEDEPEQLITGIKKDVDSFVNGEEQFDDLTAMCILYHGGK